VNFGFLLFDDVEELDFVGPWEVIGMWGQRFGGPERRLIVSQTGLTVTCAKGLRIEADHDFDSCPALDYLLVPGGQGTRREKDNPDLISFIKNQAASCRQVLSVCTGSFLLQAAGLLEGKRATTHWFSLERLSDLPGVSVVEERFVRDGIIWTAAGVSAGIDLSLALIADQAGEDTAGQVQLAMEYYPSSKRYGQAHQSPQAPGYLTS
jgi:transcriptional regulator GlxA family with amidase domain